MAKNAVNKTFTRTTATGDWNSHEVDIGDALLWSDAGTWEGGVPDAGDDIEIPEGVTVILDTDGVFASLSISGVLLGSNLYPDVSLTGGSIHIEDGGEFTIGEPDDYFTGTCPIELDGAEPSSPLTNTGHERSIMVHGTGKFHVYSRSPTPYMRLGASAAASATNLTLASSVSNWTAGSDILVTPTGYRGYSEAHKCHVTTLASNVSTTAVTLDDGLNYARYGVLQYLQDNSDSDQHVHDVSAGWALAAGDLTLPGDAEEGDILTVLDERGILAPLNRGVTIQGANDSAWSTNKFGAHVMVMDIECDVFLDGVEFVRCGQLGHMGRYPIHWHMVSYDVTSNGTEDTDVLAASIATARTLTIPANTTQIFLEAYPGSNLRYRLDGVAPDASTGTQILAGKKSEIIQIEAVTSIKVIQESSGGAVKATYLKGTGDYIDDVIEDNGLQNCVFRDCAQRCIVLHGVCGLKIWNNVCYDSFGHMIFLEDGSERRNSIRYNLCVGAKSISHWMTLSSGFPQSLQQHENDFNVGSAGASGIWSTNPDNDISGNICVANKGKGIFNAYPNLAMGLSARTVNYPSKTRMLQLGTDAAPNYCIGNCIAGMAIGRLVPTDSIANSGLQNINYEPRDDDTPSGDHVRFTWRGVFVKNFDGYLNTVMWPSYRGGIVADNFGAGFTGTTFPGVGPADDETGTTRGLIDRFVISGVTLNVETPPVEWGDRASVGAASYHFTLIFKNLYFVNLPIVAGVTSGAIAWNDQYLSPTESLHLMTGIRFINADPGYRILPPAITGDFTGTAAEGRQMSQGMRDPEGFFGGGAKWHIFDAAPFTYDAAGIIDTPVFSEDEEATNHKLVTGPVYGLGVGYIDNPGRLTHPPAPPEGNYVTEAHTIFTRYDDDWVSVGSWEMEEVNNAWRTWGLVKGNSHIHKCGLEFPDLPEDGVIQEYIEFAISWLLTTGDSFILRIPFEVAPDIAYGPINYPAYWIDLTAAASLVALEGGSGNQFWRDSGNKHLYIYAKGGLQSGITYPGGDDYGDFNVAKPLLMIVEAA